MTDPPRRHPLIRFAASPWALLVVAAAAVVVPVLGCLDRDFYALEADLILAAKQDFAGIRAILAGPLKDQSPAFLWMLHGWMAVFGEGHAGIRSLNLTWGVIAVLYAYLLGRAWRSHWVGLAAALLMVAMPAYTEHARTARMYIIYIATVTGAMAHAARYLRSGRAVELVGVGAMALIGIYNHFLGFGLAALALGYLLGGTLVARPRRRALWAGATTLAVALLSIPQVLRFNEAWSRASGKSTFYSVAGSAEAFFRNVNGEQFLHGVDLHEVIPLEPPAPFWLALALLLGLLAWGVRTLPRRWDQLIAVTCFAGGQLAMFYLRAAHEADIRGRYLSFLLPVAAVLLAAAVIPRRTDGAEAPAEAGGALGDAPAASRAGRAFAVGRLVTLTALVVVFCIATGSRIVTKTRPYSEAMAWITERYDDGDVVGAYPGWTHNGLQIYAPEAIDVVATGNTSHLEQRRTDGKLFFVVSRMGQHDPKRELAWLEERAFRVETFDVYRTRVHVFDFAAAREARANLTRQWQRRLAEDADDGLRLLVGGDVRVARWDQLPASTALHGLSGTLRAADVALLGIAPPAALGDDGAPALARLGGELSRRGVDVLALLPLPGAAGRATPTPDDYAGALPGDLGGPLVDGAVRRLEAGGVRLALAGMTLTGEEDVDDARLARVRALATDADHVIVIAAWPPARGQRVAAWQQRAGERLLDAGASAVLGRTGGEDLPLRFDDRGLVAPNLGTVVTAARAPHDKRPLRGRLLYLLLRPDGTLDVETLVVRPDEDGAPLPTSDEIVRYAAPPPRDRAAYRLVDHLAEATPAIIGGPHDGKSFRPHVPSEPGDRRPRAVRRWGNDWWQFVGAVDEVCGGYPREAIWAHPVRDGVVELRFDDVPLTERLDGVLGIGDEAFDRVQGNHTKKRRLALTHLDCFVDGEPLATVSGADERGWRSFRLDTSAFAGGAHTLTVQVRTTQFGNHWFSFDAWTVEPRAPLAAPLDAVPDGPPRQVLAASLDDARVGVRHHDGRYRHCSQPLPGHKYISGEERGPDGEGKLTHRRRCGKKRDVWNSVAVTRQRAGGELRDCVWAHPVDDAALELAFPAGDLGETLSGYLAITDLALDKRDFPVYLEFAAGEQLLGRAEVATEPGWQPFAFDTSGLAGDAPLTIRVETDKQRWRHLCFWAEIR